MNDSQLNLAQSAMEKDAGNTLLWRYSQRRLSAEEIRDSLLAACGRLDLTKGAAHPFPPESTWGFSQHAPFNANYDTNHRSVYLMVQRNRRHPFLGLFDGADPNASTAQRQSTIVPPQALYFMNDRLSLNVPLRSRENCSNNSHRRLYGTLVFEVPAANAH